MTLYEDWKSALEGNPKNDEQSERIQELVSAKLPVNQVLESLLEEKDNTTLVLMIKTPIDGKMDFVHHLNKVGADNKKTTPVYVALNGTSARATPVQIPQLEEALEVVEIKAPGWTMLQNFDTPEKVLQATTPKKLSNYVLRHAQVLPPFLAQAFLNCEDCSPQNLFVQALEALKSQSKDKSTTKKKDSNKESTFKHVRDIIAFLWQAAQDRSDVKEISLSAIPQDVTTDVLSWSQALHQQHILPEKLEEALAIETAKNSTNIASSSEACAKKKEAGNNAAATVPDMPPLNAAKQNGSSPEKKAGVDDAEDSKSSLEETSDVAAASLLADLRKKPAKSRTWEDSYTLLKAYKEKYGDCNIPREWKEDSSLAEWARQQRRKQKALTQDQMAKLDALGFVWGNALKERNNKLWEDSYNRLLSYKAKHGTANPPRLAKDDENDDLSRWCVTQRQNYKRGIMTKEREAKLESIGFEWRMRKDYSKKGRPKDEDQWKKQYDNMVTLKEEKGHCNPPKVYPPAPGLHNWAYTQRKAYKEGRLDDERKALLEKIGFSWNLGDAQREELWLEQYNKLKAFHEAHGHLEIPRSGPTSDTALLKWLRRQREALKCEKLSPNRKALLDKLQFDFEGDLAARAVLVEEQNWKDKFEELKALKTEKGDIKKIEATDKTDPVLKWSQKQQRLYQQGKLSAERKASLEEIGLEFEERKPRASGTPKKKDAKKAKSGDETAVSDGSKRKRGSATDDETKTTASKEKAKASVLPPLKKTKKSDKNTEKSGDAEENESSTSTDEEESKPKASKNTPRATEKRKAKKDDPEDKNTEKSKPRGRASPPRSTKAAAPAAAQKNDKKATSKNNKSSKSQPEEVADASRGKRRRTATLATQDKKQKK